MPTIKPIYLKKNSMPDIYNYRIPDWFSKKLLGREINFKSIHKKTRVQSMKHLNLNKNPVLNYFKTTVNFEKEKGLKKSEFTENKNIMKNPDYINNEENRNILNFPKSKELMGNSVYNETRKIPVLSKDTRILNESYKNQTKSNYYFKNNPSLTSSLNFKSLLKTDEYSSSKKKKMRLINRHHKRMSLNNETKLPEIYSRKMADTSQEQLRDG